MNYINEVDFAKSLQIANVRFANRVLNLQLDFNPGLTKLYRNILRFSNTTIPEEIINKVRYTLNPPTTLNAQNTADDLNTKDQLILALVKAKIGDNANSDTENVARDLMYNMLAREYIPSINWSHIDDVYKKAMMDAEHYTQSQNNS